MTAWRKPRSARLLVGSTPSISTKVHSAGQTLSRLRARPRVEAGLDRLAPPRFAELALQRGDLPAQSLTVAICLKVPPGFEHPLGNSQAGLAELALVGKRALGVKAEVAQEVRPADLAARRIEMVICPPAIRADDRLACAEQLFGLLAVAGGGEAVEFADDFRPLQGIGWGDPRWALRHYAWDAWVFLRDARRYSTSFERWIWLGCDAIAGVDSAWHGPGRVCVRAAGQMEIR